MSQRSNTKERIITSAMALIHDRGITDVGVQEICSHAGVQKGSFYHFFPSKEDVVLAALDGHWNAARDQYWRLAFAPDIPPLDRIRRFFDIAYYYYSEMVRTTGRLRGCPFGSAAAERACCCEKVSAKISSVFDEAIGHIQSALDEAVKTGQLRDGDTRLRAETIMAYFEGVLLMAKARQEPDVIRRLGRSAVKLAMDP